MAFNKNNLLKIYMEGCRVQKQLSPTFVVALNKYFINNLEAVEVRSGQFLFDQKFYAHFIEVVGVDIDNTKSEKNYYRNFKRLKRFELIHRASSDYPVGRKQISINPNHMCLINADFSKMDQFVKSRKYVLEKIQQGAIEYLYIYLLLFQVNPLSRDILSKVLWSDLIFLPEKSRVVLYKVKQTIFSSESTVYKLIVLDKEVSELLFKLTYQNNDELDKKLFENNKNYEKFLEKFRDDFLKGFKFNTLKCLNKIFHIFDTSPIEMTLNSHTISTVELTISELITLFPNIEIADYILLQEKRRICETFKEKNDYKYLETDISLHTDISDFEALSIIMYNKKKITNNMIDAAIDELKTYIRIHETIHANLIYGYIIDLLERLKKSNPDKIKISTFSNYISTLNKYVFRMIDNLDDIKIHEILNIEKRLENLKLESQKTNINILRRFFKYHELAGNFKVNTDMVYYPKSMVFDFEIEGILDEIEKRYRQDNNLTNSKPGVMYEYNILMRKMIILFAYYAGLRKNEIRSREIRDFIQHDNSFYLDVNKQGFKHMPTFSLKTASAKRRISFDISNVKHLEIVERFMTIRMNKNKDESGHKLLFYKTTKDNRISSSSLDERIFVELNDIIQYVTKRYCTLHSLRHSFVTYSMREIIKKQEKNPYMFFDKLNVPIGHSIPEATMNSYVHWDLMVFL